MNATAAWQPMDLMKHRETGDGQVTIPLMILLMRDWAQPAWIACNLADGQLTRIWDGVDDRFYSSLGPFETAPRQSHPGRAHSMSRTTILAAIRGAHW